MKDVERSSAVVRELCRLGSAAQFLTRLPLPDPGWETGRMRLALAWFPLIGLGIGALTAGVLWLAAMALPVAVAAGVALAFQLILTGALHEDGLADTADALGARGQDPEKALAIMRDSRIGAYGTIAIVLCLLLRWGAFAALAEAPAMAAATLMLAGAGSRATALPLAALLPMARSDGLGAMLARPDRGRGFLRREWAALIGVALVGLAWAGGAAITAVIGAVAVGLAVARLARRLGGMTGDLYGAAIIGAETVVLVLCTATLA